MKRQTKLTRGATEFNEIQSSKRNTYRRKVAAAKKGVPYVETSGLLREPRVPDATGPPGTTFIEDPAAAAGIDTSRSIKKQRLSTANANGGTNPDDSAMTGVDADETQEYQDAESEPDEDIEEDEEDADEVEDEEDEEEEVAEEDEMHDALEEREDQNEEDEALDNGEDSDS